MKLAALALAAATHGACPAGLPHAPAGDLRPPPGATYLTPDGAVRIVGYNDMQGIVARWDAAFAARHPGVRFAPDLRSTRSAPPALIAGRSALAPMGAEMTPDDLAAAHRAFGAPPLAVAVAHDSLNASALSGPLGIVVARTNPLTSLTLDQAAQLFGAGDAPTRWGALGLSGDWTTTPIHRLGLKPDAALAQRLEARLFPGRGFAADLVGFAHSTDVMAAVAADRQAIGFAGLNGVPAGVKVLPLARRAGGAAVAPTRSNLQDGRYPLDRQLLIYARAPLDAFVRGYLTFVLSCEGQAAIAADPLGYIPLTASQAARERAKLGAAGQPPSER